MTNISIELLAIEINISLDILLKQFSDAGIVKNKNDYVSEHEKEVLLDHLSKQRGKSLMHMTLKRKVKSFLNISSNSGKNKSVKIEFRKNKTYLKNSKLLYKKNNKITNKINLISSSNTQNLSIKNKIIKKNHNKSATDLKNLVSSKDTVNNSYNKQKEIINKNNLKDIQYKSKVYSSNKNNNKNFSVKLKKESKTTFKNKKNVIRNNKKEFSSKLSNNFKLNKDDRYTKLDKIRKINNKSARFKKRKFKDNSFNMLNKNKTKNFKNNILHQSFKKPKKNINRNITIGETITVADLSNKMAVKSSIVIKLLMNMGSIVTINQLIDQETAQLVAEEMGHKVTLYESNKLESLLIKDIENSNITHIKKTRPPVVAIMGHVDHGKTSLLDRIRSTDLASKEPGGITQNIGAYYVRHNNSIITFIDTPGHEAFTSIRSRGAKITDIIVLVIAADDGVMPQTIESINHANFAKVPIIVAINKIDKSEPTKILKIKNELVKYNIVPEEWGGDNIFVNISAKKDIGIQDLLNSISLQSEILDIKTTFSGLAKGVVIESFLDKGRGPIATVLIRQGVLKKGNIVLCGLEYGKIRALFNELGEEIKSAEPSIPVTILGLSGIPIPGDIINVVNSEKQARDIAYYRQAKNREVKLLRREKSKTENIFSSIDKNKLIDFNIILKSNVHGSLESICGSLCSLSNDKIKINIIHSGIGNITETDVSLAIASSSLIIGFNIKLNNSLKRIIEKENINYIYHSIIYKLIEEINLMMNNMISPEYKYEIIGLAKVRNVFKSPKFGLIAGCIVTEGFVKRNSSIRILRNGACVYKGQLESLRRFKEDVNEIRSGVECGIGIKNYNDVCSDDIIEVLKLTKVNSTI
ncbi:translation initiation factor IF-2 [Buchnera aphidicola (Neophyllaphis varicolor)]|uniref:translation initiation factor IF-2 n=1 Tax=Buchnera aphidicola TaxID=9 RepID=UPI0031B83443